MSDTKIENVIYEIKALIEDVVMTENEGSRRCLNSNDLNKFESWIKTIQQANGANSENANCSIFDVSQQRELLIGFKTWEVDNDIKNLLPKQLVDWYLEDKKMRERYGGKHAGRFDGTRM